MGLSAARAFCRAGHQVTVYEQGALPNPRGASVDQHRLIRFPYGASAGYTAMVADAYAAWDRLWADLGTRYYHPTGTLVLGRPADPWAMASAETLATQGHALTWLDPQTLAARYPVLHTSPADTAFFLDSGGVLQAEAIVAALAHWLGEQGVVLHAETPIASVDPVRASLTRADGGREAADVLVIAAGAWVPRLLPTWAARVTPSRQAVVYLAPPPSHAPFWKTAPMLLDIDPAAGFYLVPPAGPTRLKIGDHRFSHHGDPTDARIPTEAETHAIRALAAPRIRHFDQYRTIETKICYYTAAPEEAFLIEPVEQAWVLSGFSGHGFKFGALIGERLAATVLAGHPPAALHRWARGLGDPSHG